MTGSDIPVLPGPLEFGWSVTCRAKDFDGAVVSRTAHVDSFVSGGVDLSTPPPAR